MAPTFFTRLDQPAFSDRRSQAERTPAGIHLEGSPEAIPDHELVARVAAGDTAAFAVLYARYAATVLAIGIRVLHDIDAAEDVRQETFLRLWRQASSFRAERGAFAAWLCRIARNLALDELRRQSRTPVDAGLTTLVEQASDSRQDVEALAMSRVLAELVLKAMDRLPSAQQQAVELAYLHGWSHQEIATALGEPLGTVKSRIKYGAARLRAELRSGIAARGPPRLASHTAR